MGVLRVVMWDGAYLSMMVIVGAMSAAAVRALATSTPTLEPMFFQFRFDTSSTLAFADMVF